MQLRSTANRRSLRTVLRTHGAIVVLALSTIPAPGCKKDDLGASLAAVRVIASPGPGDTVLEAPVGINIGKAPLLAVSTATFIVENASVATLDITDISISDDNDAAFTPRLFFDGVAQEEWPVEIPSGQAATLTIEIVPTTDEVTARATIAIGTNAGAKRNQVVFARVEAIGWFVGEPALSIEYAGSTYNFGDLNGDGTPDACASVTAEGACRLPALSYGNVRLESSATETIYLRNAPPADTCLLPALADGSTDCRAACAVIFDKDVDAQNLGLGFVPADAGFSMVGAATLPFSLAPSHPQCSSTSGVVRGELRMLVRFVAGDTEVDRAGVLVLESNEPNAPNIEIPLTASIREAPIAVAQLRACTVDNPATCSTEGGVRPLSRVYLEDAGSYDLRDPSDPTLLVSRRWELLESPSGADAGLFAPQGAASTTFDFFAPLAGDYRVRLHVTNDVGIESGGSETSDVIIRVSPEERMHIQLVWDDPINDQDLHVLYADGDPAVFHERYDCFWLQCSPDCRERAGNPCNPVAQWFDDDPAFEASNPRLDRDDTEGLGPENVNVDEPRPGNYDIYVRYYGLQDTGSEPTQVTIRIFIDGLLRSELRRVLTRNDLWAVARIHWMDDGSVQVTPARSDREGSIGAVQQVNHLPYPDGYNFGPVFEP